MAVPALLALLLLCGAPRCAAERAAPLAFTMLQRTRVFRGSSVFWGNASLDGRLSHLLEGFNVTQVLPLEPPDAWARRQRDVTTYLRYFRDLVKIFSTERPMNSSRLHGPKLRYTRIRKGRPTVATQPLEKLLLQLHRVKTKLCTDTQSLSCHLGCFLFPNGTARSFYEVSLNGTAFLSFHVLNATWERRWPGTDEVAAFAARELMKYPMTTQDLQHFLNTTCVDILQVQSARTGKQNSRSHVPLVLGLILGTFALLGMAVGIFLCRGGSS